MILADKIIEERKKNGWSQEELADQLGVSRQAVSKWESAGSVPDLQRIIDLARVFGVSTDYLLKDEMEEDPTTVYSSGIENANAKDSAPLRRVTMEEANAFLSIKEKTAPIVANAISMCIVSPVVLVVLATMVNSKVGNITEQMAVAIGMVTLLGLVATAVYLFISTGARCNSYEYLERECFETEYGISGMVKEKKNAYEPTYIRGLSIGIILCILCSLPLILLALQESQEYLLGIGTGILLIMVATGVNMIIRTGIIKGSYDTLLQEGDYSKTEKKHREKEDVYHKIYWCTMTAIYLGISFYTMRWDMTWIIWPVAGVFFAAVRGMIRLIQK